MKEFATLSMLLLLGYFISSSNGMVEEERLAEYRARGYEWPLKQLVPDTPGWNTIFQRRFKQIEETIDDDGKRYNAWMQTMSAALLQPNFTESGWGLTKAPEHVIQKLLKKLHDNVDTAPLEHDVDVIEGADDTSKPLFISNSKMNDWVLEELRPMHEAWAGVPLVGNIAYGLRVYSEDSEPWPIVIEDFQGNTNEVVLESGDMLFYESSKCFHGRPHTFKGSWYSSIFVHYYPEGWELDAKVAENHYAVPPHWNVKPPPETDADKLVMVGTSMKEPNCENVWCSLDNTVKWRGPAVEGLVISNTNRTIEWEPVGSEFEEDSEHDKEEL